MPTAFIAKPRPMNAYFHSVKNPIALDSPLAPVTATDGAMSVR